MKFLFLLLPLWAFAAKEKAPQILTDAELLQRAKGELSSSSMPGKAKAPSAQEPLFVSTAAAIREEEPEIYPKTEIELGAQSYRPSGMKQSSVIGSYSYSGIKSQPMLRLGIREWIFTQFQQAMPWRIGVSLGTGISSHSASITEANGRTYEDSRLNTVFVEAGPEAEILYRNFAFGLGLGFGKLFLVQTTKASYLNKSEDSSYWVLAPSLRYQFSRNLFAKLSFTRRSDLGNEAGAKIQENSFAAFLGMGL